MKTSFGPQKIMFPLPTALVVTGTIDKANIVTIAWVSLLSSMPPTLGISVGNRGFSAEQIKKNKHFTVNIAGADIVTEADFCGISSGRDVNKFEKTGLTAMPSKHIASPIIKECPVNYECKLTGIHTVGATNHFIGEIVEIYIDTDKLKDNNDYTSIDIERINPLIYIGGAREYRKIGEKIGDAYSIGKKILF